MSLNEAQAKAAYSKNMYDCIIAGAGTGKTFTVNEKIRCLIEDEKVPGDHICAITFSKNGAKEMLDRVTRTFGFQVPGLMVSTFNALEYEIAMENYQKFGYRHKMTVIDDVQELPMCDELLRRHPIYEWVGASFTNYTQAKNFGACGALRIVADIMHEVTRLHVRCNRDISSITWNDVRSVLPESEELTSSIVGKIIALYPEYAEMKKGNDPEFTSPVITFDEQPALALKVLDDDPTYLDNHYNFEYIILDEAQDMSADQIDFLNHLINMKKFKQLMVVGDDAQAIYESLLGTSPDYLINLKDFLYKDGQKVDLHTVVMDTNYRCQQNVIDLANREIARNSNKIEKELIATRPAGEDVALKLFYRKLDEKAKKSKKSNAKTCGTLQKGEYDEIARDIKALIESGEDPNDIAFLAYSKNELKAVGDRLADLGIPAKFGAPEYLIENNRIQAVLAMNRAILLNSDIPTTDMLTVATALNNGELLDLEMDKISEFINGVQEQIQEINSSYPNEKKQLFLKFMEAVSHEDEAVESLKEKVKDMDWEEIARYLDDFYLFGENMTFRRTHLGEGVMLITAHSAKGLEWKHVFGSLDGFEKKKMSHRFVEETRRLLFVLITRAKDSLHLYSQYAAYGSTYETRVMNRFAVEIADLLNIPFKPIFNK